MISHQAIITTLLNATRHAVTEKEATDRGTADIAFSSGLYVWPEAGALHGIERTPLLDIMQGFLNSPDACVHVLVGDPGAGKTTFAKKWLAQCLPPSDNFDVQPYIVDNKKTHLQRMEETHPAPAYLPIFITLNQLLTRGKEYEIHFVYKNILNLYFEAEGLDKAAIQTLKRTCRLLVFLDGYDEIGYEGNLFRDNHWNEWPHCKFVISTRPEKFGEQLAKSEFQRALTKAFSTTGTSETDPKLTITTLRDFNEANIQAFIQQWAAKDNEFINPADIDNHPDTEPAPWDTERYWQTIESMPDLKTLATNPVILRLILFALPTLHAKFAEQEEASRLQQTRLGVYQEFVNVWFQRQVGLLGHDKNILDQLRQHDAELFGILDQAAPDGLPKLMLDYLYRYTRNLAYQALLDSDEGKLKLELLNETTLNPSLLHDVRRADPIIALLSSKQQITLLKIIRKGCLLRCDKDYFRFFHKSIIEYFTQAHIQASAVGLSDIILQNKTEFAVGAADADLNEQLTELSLNQRLITHEANLCKFLVEQVQQDKSFETVLVEIVSLSKDHPDVSTAAANAITILNQANYPINTLDLRGIRISGADLSKATLHLADFTGANLNQVNFSKAYLDSANFTSASLKDCEWGTVDKIRFNDKVTACVFTQDGRWLMVGDEGGNIHRINAVSWVIEQTKSQVPLIGFRVYHFVTCLAIGYRVDTKTHTHIPILASGSSSGLIYLWTLPSLSYERKLKGHTDFVLTLAVHSTQPLLASGGNDETIRLWNSNTGKEFKQLQGHTGSVTTLAFHPTQALLASGSYDGTIRLWNTESGEKLKILQGHIHSVLALAFHPTQLPLLASCSNDHTIRLWDSDTGEELKILQGHTDSVKVLTFHPTQALLVSGGADNTIRFWNSDTGKALKILRAHTGAVRVLAFHPTQTLLASGSKDKTIRLWHTESGEELKRLQGHIGPAAFHPTQALLASVSDPVTIQLWNINTREELIQLQGHSHSIKALAFHPTQALLASGSDDHTIRFWDCNTGKTLKLSHGHTDSVNALAFHPTQALLASSGYHATIHLLNSKTGKTLKILRGHTGAVRVLAFHPTQVLLASGGDDKTIKTIRLWHCDTGVELKRFQGHTGSVKVLAFHPTQALLASGNDDKTIRLWHCDTGAVLRQLQGHINSVCSLAFHPTEALLASGAGDNTIRLWNTEQGVCIQTITLQHYAIHVLLFKPDNTLRAGGIKKEVCELLTFIPNATTDTYRLNTVMDKRNVFFSANGLNLDKTNGLSEQQHKFLTNQGAIGVPQHFAITAADVVDIEEEKRKLAQLQKLLETLKVRAPDARQETRSLLPGNKLLNVGLYRWQVSIVRVTQSSKKMHRGIASASNNNRHVYGLLEGLDALGRRVWIRMHLVAEKQDTRYAHIENSACTATSPDIVSAKKAFMTLFPENSATGVPHEITYHVAGAINSDEMITLIEKMMNDQQRQYGSEENRIRYRLIGGKEASTQGAHNCLTWLRAHFSAYDHLEMPRASLDSLVVNPAHVLSKQGFYKTRPDVHTLDLTDWQNDGSAPSSHPVPRRGPY